MTDRSDAADDDAHWLALLGGHAAPDASAATRREAVALRLAMLRHRPTAPAGAPAAAEARIQRLLDKARADGVLTSAPADATPQSAASPSQHRRPPWAWGLAASVAAVGVALLLWRQMQPDAADIAPATLRGATVQRLTAVDPTARRGALLQALQQGGLEAQPYERLGRLGIDIALPVPLPAEQARTLARLGLAVPAGPSLQVEIDGDSGPAR